MTLFGPPDGRDAMLDQLIADNLRCQAELRAASMVVEAVKRVPGEITQMWAFEGECCWCHWTSPTHHEPNCFIPQLSVALAAYEKATKCATQDRRE